MNEKRTKLSERPWFNPAVSACIAVAFYVLLTNFSAVMSAVRGFLSNFNSIVLGAVLAAVLFRHQKREAFPDWGSLSFCLSIICTRSILLYICTDKSFTCFACCSPVSLTRPY